MSAIRHLLPSPSRPVLATLTRRIILPLLIAGCLEFNGCGRPADQSDIVAAQILNNVIHFGETREADIYKVSGWSGTEKRFTWTEGQGAVVAIPLPPNSDGVRLRMYAAAYTHPPELPTQPVEVYANERQVAHWDVAGPAQLTADIPKEVAGKSRILTLRFQTPKAISPSKFSAGGDPRTLGICCNEIELTKLP